METTVIREGWVFYSYLCALPFVTFVWLIRLACPQV